MAKFKTTSGPLTLDAEQFGKNFTSALRSISNRKDLLQIAGMTALEFMRKYFDSGRDPSTGRAWKKNSPNTIAAKGSNRINYDTGILRRSLARKKAGNIFRVSSKSVDVGTRVPHARFAQKGTKRHRIAPKQEGGTLSFITAGGRVFAKSVNHPGTPKRRVVGVTKKTTRIIGQRQKQFLVDKLEGKRR